MAKQQHALGPWDLESDETSSGMMFTVYDKHGSRLTDPYIAEDAARLIAAAPDLLAALDGLMSVLLSTDVDARIAAHKAARAALHLAKHGDAVAPAQAEQS